jgi:hypothetical protein
MVKRRKDKQIGGKNDPATENYLLGKELYVLGKLVCVVIFGRIIFFNCFGGGLLCCYSLIIPA